MVKKRARHHGGRKSEVRSRKHRIHTVHARPTSVVRHLTSVSWKAPDFHLHPRGGTWSFFVVATGITAAILFALFKQYTLAVIVFLAGLVMVLGSNDQPQQLTHTITPKGFLINNWLLSWNDVKSFWIASVPEGGKLHFATVKRGLPIVTVYLGGEGPDKIRQHLAQYLPEHPTRGEQLTDILARLLRV